jgi:hypothetical protein
MRLGIRLLAVVALFAGACASDPGTDTASQAAIGPATLTSTAASYPFLSSIGVTWSGMPGGSASEYIAIAPQGSPNTTITRWKVTGGAGSGSTTFEGPPSAGTYVVRGFGADDSFQGESDPFVVEGPGMATVAPSAATYTMTDPIVINWSGLPGNATDWIAIAPVGSSDATTADWLYTGGGTSGSTTFMDGLAPTTWPPGTYVARSFINDTFTKTGESAPFTVTLQGGVTVTTNAASYSVQQQITVSWTGLPGNQADWIGIYPTGSTTISNPTRWLYTGGQVNGSVIFSGLDTPGSYNARAFENDSYNLLAQSAPFAVTAIVNATITTNATAYTLGQPIIATWNNGPGNAADWISYAPVGSPDSTVTRWAYVGGQAAGSFSFEGPSAPGTYVARFYVNDSYTKIAQSVQFTVN